MKILGTTAQLATGMAVCAALAWDGWAEPGSAKVQAIRAGSAQYSTDGVNYQTLQAKAVLEQGCTIKTDSMGIVDLYLGKNGPLVRLTPATTLALTTLTFDPGAGETVISTELGLSTGRILGIVRKMSASSRYDVKTPVGTCQIQGTKYEISATGRVLVEEGVSEVGFAPPGASSPTRFEVQAGYTFDPTLNTGRGGVVPTLASARALQGDEYGQMREGMSGEERAQIWMPSPSWMAPKRPFNEPGRDSDIDAPWVVPIVSTLTTQVAP